MENVAKSFFEQRNRNVHGKLAQSETSIGVFERNDVNRDTL
jgi:hypothetical protein